MKMKWIFKGIAIGIMIVAFAFAFGWLVMWLWNALIPVIFHGPTVTYMQAIGLLVLTRLLVGRGGGHWGHHKRNHMRNHWREKIKNMSPEEREAYLSRMKGRCGSFFRAEWEKHEEQKSEEHKES